MPAAVDLLFELFVLFVLFDFLLLLLPPPGLLLFWWSIDQETWKDLLFNTFVSTIYGVEGISLILALVSTCIHSVHADRPMALMEQTRMLYLVCGCNAFNLVFNLFPTISYCFFLVLLSNSTLYPIMDSPPLSSGSFHDKWIVFNVIALHVGGCKGGDGVFDFVLYVDTVDHWLHPHLFLDATRIWVCWWKKGDKIKSN